MTMYMYMYLVPNYKPDRGMAGGGEPFHVAMTSGGGGGRGGRRITPSPRPEGRVNTCNPSHAIESLPRYFQDP
jgi:hypothetical protein